MTERGPVGRESSDAWLRLAKPIPGTLGDTPVLVLDLSRSAALLTADCSYESGMTDQLSFIASDIHVRVMVLVTAVEDHDDATERDLLVRFAGHGPGLEEFIAGYEQQIHLAELANLEGHIEQNVIDGDRMLSDLGDAAREREPFLRCRHVGGRWRHEVTRNREQPPDGFTVSAAETDDQVRLLQLAWEETDEDGRRALREFAAVSLPPAR